MKRPPSGDRPRGVRETVTSSRKMSQSGERPIVVRSPWSANASPARPPPDADDERRALDPTPRAGGVSSCELLGV